MGMCPILFCKNKYKNINKFYLLQKGFLRENVSLLDSFCPFKRGISNNLRIYCSYTSTLMITNVLAYTIA